MCKHCEYPYEAIEPFGTNFTASFTIIPNSDESTTVIHSVEFCPMRGKHF